MSDYEDIWEKTPGPESPNQDQCDGIISPTLSEKRFKQFLFNRFFDQNYSTVPELTIESTEKAESEYFNHIKIHHKIFFRLFIKYISLFKQF